MPGSEGAEVRDCFLAWGCAEVGDESFADVEGAEDVCVEGGVVFLGSFLQLVSTDKVEGRWMTYEVSSTAPTRR